MHLGLGHFAGKGTDFPSGGVLISRTQVSRLHWPGSACSVSRKLARPAGLGFKNGSAWVGAPEPRVLAETPRVFLRLRVRVLACENRAVLGRELMRRNKLQAALFLDLVAPARTACVGPAFSGARAREVLLGPGGWELTGGGGAGGGGIPAW